MERRILKRICGFANAQGDTLIIGKDDNGIVVGVKLLEELPNKITAILGIIADVNLHETEQGDIIEIVIEPQPNPVITKANIIIVVAAPNRNSKVLHWINSYCRNMVERETAYPFQMSLLPI
ncbi:AlbA family DNA-binding domain-containing protein [Dysgonomonas sp.]